MKKNSTSYFLLLSVLVLLCLPGCLIDRLIDLKNQLCDFEQHYKIINHPSGISFIAKHPILYDSDIITLMGASPSVIKTEPDGRLAFEYIVFKEDPATKKTYSLSSAFKFIKMDGQYKLQEASLGKNITDVFSRKLISDVLKSLCRSEKNIMARLVTVSINEIDTSLLPNMALLETILGRPDVTKEIDKTNKSFVYFFSLKSGEPSACDSIKKAMVEIFYNKDKKTIYRVRTHYLRYRVDAVFEKKRFYIKVLLSPVELEHFDEARKYLELINKMRGVGKPDPGK